MSVEVDLDWQKIDSFNERIERAAAESVAALAEDIKVDADVLIPKLTGSTMRTGHIELGTGVNTVSASVEYDRGVIAAAQEQGWIKRNGKIIVFKSYTTPGTGGRYLRRSLLLNAAHLSVHLALKVKDELSK